MMEQRGASDRQLAAWLALEAAVKIARDSDEIELDGRSPPAGIPVGVAGVSTAKMRLTDATERAVAGSFNGERIVGRSWPTAGNHVVLLELHE